MASYWRRKDKDLYLEAHHFFARVGYMETDPEKELIPSLEVELGRRDSVFGPGKRRNKYRHAIAQLEHYIRNRQPRRKTRLCYLASEY
jgi:hypothetical protein